MTNRSKSYMRRKKQQKSLAAKLLPYQRSIHESYTKLMDIIRTAKPKQ